MSAGDIFVTDADKRIAELEAENQRLRDAAWAVLHTMRGSGGINPEGAKALRNLQALLEDEQ